MDFEELEIPGAFKIKLKGFSDDRGFFARTFCKKEFQSIIGDVNLVQINHSMTSTKGTIRGMHFQKPPHMEDKLIRVVKGEIYDVLVDLRAGSPTFLKWAPILLSEENMDMVYIPKGCAHGFQSLTDDVIMIYHHTEYYMPNFDSGVLYNDSKINIEWPEPPTVISDKDKSYPKIDSSFKGLEI